MIGADMQVTLSVAHVAHDAVDHTRRLEQAHHLVIEMHSARQWIGVRFLFANQDREIRFAE